MSFKNLPLVSDTAIADLAAAIDDTNSVDLTYNEGTDVLTADVLVDGLTIEVTTGGLAVIASADVEAAQDAVGTILVDSTSINFTYTDSTPSITAAVILDGSSLSIGSGGLSCPSAHVHSNATALGEINQDLATTDAVSFLDIAVSGVIYNQLSISPLQMHAETVENPSKASFGGGSSLTYHFTGTGTSAQYLFGGVELPNDYKEGTDLVPYIKWASDATGAGDVAWNMAYDLVIPGFAVSSVTSVTGAATTAIGTAFFGQTSELTAITGTALEIGSVILFRLGRDPADSRDTLDDDVSLLSVGFYYRTDGVGSTAKQTKVPVS
jgi:hypothetical protein